MQLFLSSAFTLLDDGIFSIQENEKQTLLQAMILMLEKILNVKKGRFLNVFQESVELR